MGKLTEPAAYAITQVWRDAAYLYGFGYTAAAQVLSAHAVDLCGDNEVGLCHGCGRISKAPATVQHQPWCVHVWEGYDPTEELELEALRALWGDA